MLHSDRLAPFFPSASVLVTSGSLAKERYRRRTDHVCESCANISSTSTDDDAFSQPRHRFASAAALQPPLARRAFPHRELRHERAALDAVAANSPATTLRRKPPRAARRLSSLSTRRGLGTVSRAWRDSAAAAQLKGGGYGGLVRASSVVVFLVLLVGTDAVVRGARADRGHPPADAQLLRRRRRAGRCAPAQRSSTTPCP